jgi:dTDP-4-amino-4,6-dideoxygalactose transaminase
MNIIPEKLKPSILSGKALFDKRLELIDPDIPGWEEIKDDLQDFYSSTILTKGPLLKQFEQNLKEYIGAKNVVCLSNCTSGLMLTFKLLGIEGEVILPSFTFISTGTALLWQNNIKPVFVDIEPDTFNIDPDRIIDAITPETSAIVVVNIFGNPCNIDRLTDIASKYNLKLIFDSAHAMGSKYKGIPAGNSGDAECFSCSPTKILITGEGGFVSTNNDQLAYNLNIGREYGNPGNYDSILPGINARMSEFHALLGLHGLKNLDSIVAKRNHNAAYIISRLSELPGLCFQKVDKENISTYKDLSFTIEKDFELNRDQLATVLNNDNIATRFYFYPPLHCQTNFKNYKNEYDNLLPVTNKVAESIITIPLSSKFIPETLDKLCFAIENAYKFRGDIIDKLERY